MSSMLQIHFRGFPPSEALCAEIEGRFAKLQELVDTVASGIVVVEQPHRHHRQGKLFHVRVEVSAEGLHLVAGSEPGRRSHEVASVAVHDCFRAVERQLKKQLGRRRELAAHARRHAPRVTTAGSAEDFG
jgi:hypothetical protein